MTNHDMIATAVKKYRGKVLETGEIKKIVFDAFPQFNEGSLLPNDHASGNKSCCSCVGQRIRFLTELSPENTVSGD